MVKKKFVKGWILSEHGKNVSKQLTCVLKEQLKESDAMDEGPNSRRTFKKVLVSWWISRASKRIWSYIVAERRLPACSRWHIDSKIWNPLTKAGRAGKPAKFT
ncbi:unnamed protein product [Hermetia illucens]|uniref:Uncharacterized protein n=1 Tax=Hermetia illucens TaxID=343691 RepID=A0A7R8V3J7_HERIL|nr:unnamed protein product [Hermetia illucens]